MKCHIYVTYYKLWIVLYIITYYIIDEYDVGISFMKWYNSSKTTQL